MRTPNRGHKEVKTLAFILISLEKIRAAALKSSRNYRVVGFGEHLYFEGAPLVELSLQQDPTKRIPEEFEGEAIESGLTVPRLTEYERQRVNDARATSAKALGKDAAEVRARHDRALAEGISARLGMPMVTAQLLVTAASRCAFAISEPRLL
jgi:hypothetical protein